MMNLSAHREVQATHAMYVDMHFLHAVKNHVYFECSDTRGPAEHGAIQTGFQPSSPAHQDFSGFS